jgi:hypothetical protein
MSLTPEELSTLQLLRTRISSGDQVAPDELKVAIRLLRADRMNAIQRSAERKARGGAGAKAPKAPARPAGELLGKLGIPGL